MLGLNTLRSQATFENDGSHYADGTEIEGNEGGEAGGFAFIPNFYVVQPVTETLALGLGITATSGTETSWDKSWVGRYHGIRTSSSTLDINPVVAWRVTPKLSIGAGLDVQHANMEMVKAIVFLGADGRVKLEGESWACGYSLGIMYEPVDGTRFGLGYRSAVSHRIEGEADFTLPLDTDYAMDLDLPAMLSVGFHQDLGERFALLVDLAWTEWSSLDKLTTEFDSSLANSTVEMKWENSMRYAIGLDYYYSDKLTLRCGTAYDENPVSSEEYRNPIMPDADRIWVTFGVGYKVSEQLQLDFGYLHIFFDNVESSTENETGEVLQGTFGGGADLFSFAMTYKY
jgi:long-chain fatty acid transport protein